MKDYNDAPNSNNNSVKKFRYIPPTKSSASKSFFHETNSPKLTSPRHSSFDPDKAWSIRKDISLGLSAPPAISAPPTTSSYSYSYPSAFGSSNNSVYSRHHNTSVKSTTGTEYMLRGGSNDPSSKNWSSWQSGSRGTKFNPSYKSNKPDAVNNDFDFSPLTPNHQHFGKSTIENYPKLQPSGNDYIISFKKYINSYAFTTIFLKFYCKIAKVIRTKSFKMKIESPRSETKYES